MGTSNWQNISYVIELIRAINPNKILDFGVGFGRWGILSREFLEVWDEDNYTGIWNRQIDGVEIFSDYLKPYHLYFYDNIYVEEGYNWLKKCEEKYNLMIYGDVLEHFEKQIALDIMNISLEKAEYILINMPIGNNWRQLGSNGNDYEEHKSVWLKKDFNQFQYKVLKIFNDYVGREYCVALVSKYPIKINNLLRKRYGQYYRIRNKLIYTFNLKKLVEIVRKRKH